MKKIVSAATALALSMGTWGAAYAQLQGASEGAASSPGPSANPYAKKWQAPRQVVMMGETYVLAWKSEQPTVQRYEYVRASETTENWTHMVTLLNSNGPIDALVRGFLETSKPLQAAEPVVLQRPDTKDYYLDVLLIDRANRRYEQNIMRYAALPGGVRTMIFQTRLDYVDNQEQNEKRVRAAFSEPRKARFDALKDLSF